MAIAQIPAPATSSVPNWTLLQTATPSGVASVTFSGLSGYSKYRVIGCALVGTLSNIVVALQLNGDSGSNYRYFGNNFDNGYPNSINSSSSGKTSYLLTQGFYSATAAGSDFNLDVDHALLLSNKVMESKGYGPNDNSTTINAGHYQTTSPLTSLTILTTVGGNFTAGTIELLGAN